MPVDPFRDELQTSLGETFTVEQELGGGGMSRVFVVTDRTLGRRLVIKVPPVEAGGALSIDRFAREITIAARLQHPHIVPLIAAGVTSSGAPFYTMPFVPGESLRDRVRQGPIPRAEALRILRDVASALAYAHKQGVVHRDIKPENVLLHDDSAVVTDFGIAKARDLLRGGTEAGVTGTLTAVGTSLGTPAYMAPEQAAGDEIDHRADIYSWGMIAYELLSGAHPFAAKTTAQQLIAAQIAENPPPLTASDVGAAMSTLVMRCLAKNPAERPDSATELVRVLDTPALAGVTSRPSVRGLRGRWAAIALGIAVVIVAVIVVIRQQRALAAVGAPPAARSLAVLSFENASHDTASDYLVEGLSDELRSRLTGIPGLAVKGRASSAQFVGRADPRDVAKKLGVTHVLTGVVRRSGDHVQVTAELDDASTGDPVWSKSYDRDIRELASLRDSLAARVAGELRLGATAAGPAAERETSDFDAYDQFLQGQHAFQRLDFARAVSHYREATRRDPSFARAWASLTIALVSEPRSGVVPRDSALAAAQASLARTIALTPHAPLTRVADASVRGALFKFQEAAEILDDVVAHDPQDVFAQQQYVYILGCLGRIADALAVVERIRRIDPLNPFAGIAREYVLMNLHRFQESADAAHRDLELNPTNWISLRNASVDYVFLGKPDSAVRMMEAAWRVDSASFSARRNLAFAYAAAGRWADVDRLEADGKKLSAGNSPEFFAAELDIIDGRYDSAMRHVEQGVAAREPMFATAWLSCDPGLDVLKRNPRFAAVAASIGARVCAPVEHWPLPVRPGQ